jgi:fermentation-respiration switch protein FrsA (DUF1100 family)
MTITVILGLLLGYLVILGFVYIWQKNLIYYPSRDIYRNPGDINLEFDDLRLETKDGKHISAWYIPAEKSRGVLLFCHGNAGNIADRLESILIFHELRLDVLLFDYRGYGTSEGSPNEKGTYLDAEAAWEYLVNEKNIPPEKIVLFGESLGSAIAAHVALKHKVGGLIVESGFTSIPDMGRLSFPYLPVSLLSRFRYSTIDIIDKIKAPKLFIHSSQDEIVPYEYGVTLYEKAREPKEFIQIKGSHNEGFFVSEKIFREGIGKFINKYI